MTLGIGGREGRAASCPEGAQTQCWGLKKGAELPNGTRGSGKGDSPPHRKPPPARFHPALPAPPLNERRGESVRVGGGKSPHRSAGEALPRAPAEHGSGSPPAKDECRVWRAGFRRAPGIAPEGVGEPGKTAKPRGWGSGQGSSVARLSWGFLGARGALASHSPAAQPWAAAGPLPLGPGMASC